MAGDARPVAVRRSEGFVSIYPLEEGAGWLGEGSAEGKE